MGAHSQRRLGGGRYYLNAAVIFLAVIGALGGASRADEIQQVPVTLAALIAIVAALWPLQFAPYKDARGELVGLALIYLLIAAQLVPLPPDMWASLPGRETHAAVAREAGTLVWRPLSLSPDRTLGSLAGLLPATAVILLALHLDLKKRVRLAHWVVGIACVSATLGLVQLASGGESFHLFRTTSENSAVGLFANRNHQGVLMACALPLLAALLVSRQRETHGPGGPIAAAGAAAMLMVMAIAASGSRMALLLGALGLLAALTILLLCARRPFLPQPLSPRMWALAAAGAAAALVPAALLFARSGVIGRLAAGQPVDDTRIAALPAMLEAARAFMPLGSGLGTFQPVFERFEPHALLSDIYLNHAHNEPVQLAIEGGLAALLLLAAFLLWWLRSAALAAMPRDSRVQRAMGIAAASATLIMLLSSLVDYPLRTPALSALFALFCVELLRSRRPRRSAAVATERHAA